MFTNWLDSLALGRAEGLTPLQDGRLEAVTGPMEPLGEPLVSPLSRTPSVAYQYEITHVETITTRTSKGRSVESQEVTDYSGLGLTPAVIRSKRGEVCLQGVANLDSFWRKVEGGLGARHVHTYFQKTPPVEADLGEALAVAQILTGYQNDAPVQRDWHLPGGGVEGKRTFVERVVTAGETVTALGRYSAEAGGLVPHTTWNPFDQSQVTRLLRGPAKVARKALLTNHLATALFLLVTVVGTNAFLYMALTHPPK